MQKRKKRKIKRISKYILIFALMLFTFSCGNDAPKPVKVFVPIKKRNIKKSDNSSKIVFKKFKKFKFSLNDTSRNPFKPFFSVKEVKEESVVDKNIIRTPLTMYNLSQFKLVAIIKSKHKKPVAMVETEDHLGFFFKIGDYIGTELYKVVAILDNKVVLEKKKRDFFNKIKIEKKEITLETEGE